MSGIRDTHLQEALLPNPFQRDLRRTLLLGPLGAGLQGRDVKWEVTLDVGGVGLKFPLRAPGP